jgi:beta-lactamase class A
VNRNAFLWTAAAAAVLPLPAEATTLEDEIARAAAASSGVVGVWARRMSPSDPVTYNAGEQFPSASTIKLVILVSLFQLAERTPGLFGRTVTLKLSDFIDGSEALDAYNPGDSISIDTLARAMIERSDNTASNVLIDVVGLDGVAATIRQAGLTKTQLHRHFVNSTTVVLHPSNLTCARDMGMLLYQLERGAHEGIRTIASPASCRAMIDILLLQEDRDKLARGLPPGTPLANKSGEINGVRNDVGIVDPMGNSPYVVAVLTKDLSDFSLGDIAIRRISRVLYGALY